MRLFLALEPPPALRASVWERVRRCAVPGREARWVRPEGLHLTLDFLGEVAEEALEKLFAAGETACASCAAFVAELTRGGWFPPRGNARALWVGVRPLPELLVLQERLVGAARPALGLPPPPARPFHAHMTLARCDPPWPVPWASEFVAGLGSFAPDCFAVREVTLFRSHVGAGGSRYVRLGGFALAGSAA